MSYANVAATLALCLAVTGGIAWALERNSVRSKHIVNEQVKAPDVASPPDWREVQPHVDDDVDSIGTFSPDPGVGAQCNFLWDNVGGEEETAAFYRDAYGIVHLKGRVTGGYWVGDGCGIVFILPSGMRPEKLQAFPTHVNDDDSDIDEPGLIYVRPDGLVRAYRDGNNSSDLGTVTLDGINFRCAPSGQDGCA